MTTDSRRPRSRKRSGTSSHSRQPPKEIEIFVDRCLGRKIADPLRAAGVTVHLHDDHFAQNVEDQDWLVAVGEFGWVVLTKDKWIRRRQLERDALLAANLKVFCFTSGNVPFDEMSRITIDALPAIRKLADSTEPPFIAGVYRDASVRIIFPKEDR